MQKRQTRSAKTNDDAERVTGSPARRPARFGLGWGLAVGLLALLLGLALLPPFVPEGVRGALMTVFAPACHQIAERSFAVDGVSLAICHRCTGIYGGMLASALAFVVLWRYERVWDRQARLLLLGACVPALLDWGLHVAGLWYNTPGTRVATGLVAGLVVGLYFARALVQATTPGHFVTAAHG